MVFSSFVFLCYFLPFVFIAYFCCRDLTRKNIFLLLSSLFFYGWAGPKYLFIMLFVIFFAYTGALSVSICNKKIYKNILLCLFLIFIFSFLFYFKYFNFCMNIFNDVYHKNLQLTQVVLPVGISFYTFQAVSYLVDVYRGMRPQKNPLNLALYISLFPQLVAGPIVKYQTIATALTQRKHSIQDVYEGITRFIVGLSKKILIADTLAMSVDKIFETPIGELSLSIVWLGIVFYAFQIYFDFSGYSDMAIGLGRVFGFRFLENFNFPYISKSVTEFWRRWHISLSSWFKEYVYIPLGGSRSGLRKTLRNLLIVFFLTGLWHGAEYTFVIWGLWHAFFIMMEKIIFWLKKVFSIEINLGFLNVLLKTFSWLYTFFVVVIGWVFFRSNNVTEAFLYLRALFNKVSFTPDFYAGYYVPEGSWFVFALAVGLSLGFGKKLFDLMEKTPITRVIKDILLFIYLFFCIVFLTATSFSPFIYFNF
ncbi:MAG: MBOAT family protein [Alphaproteobacteria bacterium]|nr:MBOAT family protein [Alphaproteobacteria bacterium]